MTRRTDDTPRQVQDTKAARLVAAMERLAAQVENLARVMAKNALTIDEAAAYMGITKRTVRQLCNAHELPHYIDGSGKGEPMFLKSELEAWMIRFRVPTKEETDRLARTAYVTARVAPDLRVPVNRGTRQRSTPPSIAMSRAAEIVASAERRAGIVTGADMR